jgi:hypothetical protein
MRNSEFREWLKGFFELSEENVCLSPQQIQIIVNHMNLAKAVEGEWDRINQEMRTEIDAFRNNASRTADDFQNLTVSIQQHLLQA